MKAVVVKDVGILEIQDVPEPEPKQDEIKVKIAYAGICGSDPKIVDGIIGISHPEGAIGEPQKPTPMPQGPKILGHEASGTILKLARMLKEISRLGNMSQ